MGEPTTEPALPSGWRGFALRGLLAGLRASLWISPRPTAWVIRRLFARSGRQLAGALAASAPVDVSGVTDERYAGSVDARLDVYTPCDTRSPLPTVVWTHGGAFVGGSKDEIRDYLRRIAASGLTVVGVEYSLAPNARYPTAVRQVMAALGHLQANADRLCIDPDRIMLAGDSAGAHITAQVAAIVTNPRYAAQVDIEPTIEARQLQAVALCCGVFDLGTLVRPESPLKDVVRAVGWAYSGRRHYQRDHTFLSSTAIARHVTGDFPATFVTVGNADPLRAQSRAMVAALESQGVPVESLVYPEDHQPPLGHEYQFDLSLADGRAALERLLAFFHRPS